MPKRHRPGESAVSVLRHVEEIILATSGEDAFELVFSVAAARMVGGPRRGDRATWVRRAIEQAHHRHPTLEVSSSPTANDDLLVRVLDLLELADADRGALDAVFESLVPRVSKADKGQFFTPRHVVDFIIGILAPKSGEVVVDPACGSGAFLAHARAHEARVRTFGCDVDARAVRVARLLALADGVAPDVIVRGDGLRGPTLPEADVVATNPPFAGRASAEGFETAAHVRTPERDVLFLERSIRLLRPGGRLGIVLPYNKASGQAFAGVRRWLIDRARVLAVVGLPRETFLPHTSQRTFILFAQRRTPKARPRGDEPTMLLVSERAGKDSSGEPVFLPSKRGDDRELDHDLEDVSSHVAPFLRREGFSAA